MQLPSFVPCFIYALAGFAISLILYFGGNRLQDTHAGNKSPARLLSGFQAAALVAFLAGMGLLAVSLVLFLEKYFQLL